MKLDSILESTQASSSSTYSQVTVKAFLETPTTEHAVNLTKANLVVENSATTCKEATRKVDKLLSDIQSFMGEFRTLF